MPQNRQNLSGNNNNSSFASSSSSESQRRASSHVTSSFLSDALSFATSSGRKSASPTYYDQQPPSNNNNNFFQNFYLNQQNSGSFSFLQQPPVFSSTAAAAASNVSPSLKIPTTPTRSKSLSPLRQPAKIRHKPGGMVHSFESVDFQHPTAVDIPTTSSSKKTPQNLPQSSSFSSSSGFFKPSTVDNSSFDTFQAYKSAFKLAKDSPSSTAEATGSQGDNNKPKSEHTKSSAIDNKTTTKTAKQRHHHHHHHLHHDKHPSGGKLHKKVEQLSASTSSGVDKSKVKQVTTAEKPKTTRIKLPLNVRMLNLENFPRNQAPNAKRQFSLTMQRMKQANTQEPSKSLEVLKKNVQYFVNDQFKTIINDCKKDLIEPALNNMKKNAGQCTSNDSISEMIGSIFDEAKQEIATERAVKKRKQPSDEVMVQESNNSNTNNSQ